MTSLLIVEDDPYVQRFYQRLFEINKYDCKITGSGLEGIELAKTLQPRLILLDIMLPKMNGLEVLEQLKNDPVTQNITTIMLTNIDDAEIVGKATKLGADGFIVKHSTPPEKLLEMVQGYING